MRRHVAGVAAAVGVLLVGYALFSEPSDEEQIVEQLTRLEAALNFQSPPNILQRTASLNAAFSKIATDEVEVRVSERGLSANGRRELAATATRATAALQRFELDFQNAVTQVEGASARTSVDVSVEAELGSELRRDQRRAQLTFQKQDGDWLLTRVEVLPR